jgi:hypothetical protein
VFHDDIVVRSGFPHGTIISLEYAVEISSIVDQDQLSVTNQNKRPYEPIAVSLWLMEVRNLYGGRRSG